MVHMLTDKCHLHAAVTTDSVGEHGMAPELHAEITGIV